MINFLKRQEVIYASFFIAGILNSEHPTSNIHTHTSSCVHHQQQQVHNKYKDNILARSSC